MTRYAIRRERELHESWATYWRLRALETSDLVAREQYVEYSLEHVMLVRRAR